MCFNPPCFPTFSIGDRKNKMTLLGIGLASFGTIVATSVRTQAQAPFVISNFNGVGPDYIYGDFTGTRNPTTYDLSGRSNGGVGWGYGPPINLSAYATGVFALDAQLLPGNVQDIQVLIDTQDTGVLDGYVYYYILKAAELNTSNFSTVFSKSLNNPDFVLDAAHNFATIPVGAPGHVPDLTKVTNFGIQAYIYGNNAFFNYRLDNFAIRAAVPAPGSLITALIGIVPGVLLLRRRRK